MSYATEHMQRRARLGMPMVTRPVSVWYQSLAEREAQSKKELLDAISKYRCVVDSNGPLFLRKLHDGNIPVRRARRAVRMVAYIWDVSVDQIMGDDRSAAVVSARHAAIHVVAKITKWSLPELGRRFGGRDHTTILHALKKIAATKPRRAYQPRVYGKPQVTS